MRYVEENKNGRKPCETIQSSNVTHSSQALSFTVCASHLRQLGPEWFSPEYRNFSRPKKAKNFLCAYSHPGQSRAVGTGAMVLFRKGKAFRSPQRRVVFYERRCSVTEECPRSDSANRNLVFFRFFVSLRSSKRVSRSSLGH